MGNFGKNQNHPTPQTSVSGREHVNLCKGVDIHRGTLKVERDQQDPEKYLLQFTYDAYVPGRIIVYFYSKLRDDSIDDLTTKEDVTPLITFNVQRGFGQKFRQESGSGVDFSSNNKLNDEREVVYMLAIQAVGISEEKERMNSGNTTAFQFTQATFDNLEEKGECEVRVRVRVTYQSLHMDGVRYVLYDTYEFDRNRRLLVSGNEIGKGSNDD